MEYVARFKEFDGQLFRFDTRIYLEKFNENVEGVCVGSIIGKNPGSAAPTELDQLRPLELNGDKMLPTVGARYLQGYYLAGKTVPANAFVRVWNLFYVCNKDLGKAINMASALNPLPICPSEQFAAPINWFGWGGDSPSLNKFKTRFIERRLRNAFYYDHHAKRVVSNTPSGTDFAKHTQGMPAEPVNMHLAKII